ncbi:uncharacterized protein CTRU02_210726 [Colletotrichum truncatum]|uniref:Uncharacterized protein n=1 Tax=Colletotrichum truncatum TaxID=5467 RepID=A0ACC3YQ05_COLTU|nr:uncharacterized protein CTRU02_03784 [Colletotrichum truncatum]KAF6796806.1 hypothetical protein CTRU02_03784 [Colletotrichum truncatum]
MPYSNNNTLCNEAQPERETFHAFPRLPTEVQDLIWHFALEEQPSAHFVTLEKVVLGKFGPTSSVPKRYQRLVPILEILTRAPPPAELATGEHETSTMSCALKQTSLAARKAAFRLQESWVAGQTLQLYGANRTARSDALNQLIADEDILGGLWEKWRNGNSIDPNSHGEYPASFIVNVPSLLVDSTQDLIIVRYGWADVAGELRMGSDFRHWSPNLPIQKAPYIALEWPGGFQESNFNLGPFLFMRFRYEVLYVLVNPDDLKASVSLEPTTPETAREQREILEKPFVRPIENQISTIPEKFWYGKREFFVISWEDVEKRMISRPSRALHVIIKELLELRNEEDICPGCGDPGCEHRHENFPVAWRIMSWRDAE